MAVTIAEIVDGITATLGAAASIARSESYDELGEAVVDTPMLQVYPESGRGDPGGFTDRTTMRGGVKQAEIVVHADLYATIRHELGQDMARLVTGMDELIEILDSQDLKPYFGVEGIRAFAYSWDRVMFEYSGSQYMAVRFVIRLRIF